jgi:DNA-binding response OmpR family regulator
MLMKLPNPGAVDGQQAPLGGRLLVVDDDATVRGLIVEALRDDGHVVSEATHGAPALAWLRAASFDLLITDLGLPGGMTGLQLAAAALEIAPALKLLVITGYLERDALALGDGRRLEVLVKPFKLDVLSARVAAMLG